MALGKKACVEALAAATSTSDIKATDADGRSRPKRRRASGASDVMSLVGAKKAKTADYVLLQRVVHCLLHQEERWGRVVR